MPFLHQKRGDPAWLGIARPHQRAHSVGKFDLFNLKQADRTARGDFARLAYGGQIFKSDRLGSEPRRGINHHLTRQRQPQRGGVRLARNRRHIDRAQHIAGKQAPCAGEHFIGGKACTHGTKHIEHHCGRRHSLTNVDCIDNAVHQIAC